MTRVHLDDASFGRLAALLRTTAGLSFDVARRDSLGYSVAERLRVSGLPDVASYLDLLDSPAGAAELQALLDEVTIPETHFFRNPPQVRALRKYVLPELLRQAAGSRRLRIWSAGCSTGEEPYTVALLVRELLPASADWDVRVLATDISNRALTAARDARYSERSFVMTDPIDLGRWFTIDTTDGAYHLRDEVRELVEVRHHNLVTDPPPMEPGECDLVLCRNVTIYFDRETTRRLMQRLHDSLRPGGYLFLGHSETLWQVSDAFELTSLGDAFVYRRPLPDDQRRRVLPDRRTENELSPLRADRRRRGPDRRGRDGDAANLADPETDEDAVPVTWPEAMAPIVSAATPPAAPVAPAAPATPATPTLPAAPWPVLPPDPAPGLPPRRRASDSPRRRASDHSKEREPGLPGGTGPHPASAPVYPGAPELADPLQTVRAALSAGRYAEARDLVAQVVAADPLRAEAHYLQGVALTNLGRDAEAAVVLRRAVYLDPDSGFAHFLLGGALYRLGETVAAARCYRAAAGTLGRRPGDAIAEELGGRSVADLAAACLRLAQQAESEGRAG